MGAVSMVVACAADAPTTRAMAWLGDHALVNDGDVEVELSRQGGSLRGRFNDPRHEEYREKTVRRLAERQMLYKVARHKGWLDTRGFALPSGRAVAAEVRRKVAAQHEQVTDAEIEAYYAEHANESAWRRVDVSRRSSVRRKRPVKNIARPTIRMRLQQVAQKAAIARLLDEAGVSKLRLTARPLSKRS